MMSNKKPSYFLFGLGVFFALWLGAIFVFLVFGPVRLGFNPAEFSRQFLRFISGQSLSDAGTIWFRVRFPRALAGLLVGGGLALAGACFQGLLRNPLADPYLLGVSGGSAFGAVLGMVIFKQKIPGLIPLLAFIGALISVGLTLAVARIRGKLPAITLLLAGVVVNAFFSALVMLILSIFPQRHLPDAFFWMLGRLGSQSYAQLGAVLIYFVPAMIVLFSFWRDFNIFALGDEHAQQLGIEVERTKIWVFILASLLTASVVSISGLIGFVGLMVPHIIRLIFGPDHRFLLPFSFFAGGVFLIICDLLARCIIAPSELPVGVLTAILGGPFFIWLLWQVKQELGE